jgi:flagellar motility protein MotE (MotC chaperone)
LSEADAASKAHEDQLVQTSSRLAAAEQDIKSAEAAIMQRDQQIKELQAKNSSLEEQLKGKTQSDEEYTTKIQQLATMYAKMTPTKSAPIMENLTLSEQVLVLSMMKTDDRVKILEKMDPKKAADASILLKDQSTVKDRELAALQDKIKQLTEAGTKPSQQLTKDDLRSTFAAMTPKSSAIVLLEMNNNNPDKVLSILSSMDSQGRSRILTAMSETSKETAALISARLVQ